MRWTPGRPPEPTPGPSYMLIVATGIGELGSNTRLRLRSNLLVIAVSPRRPSSNGPGRLPHASSSRGAFTRYMQAPIDRAV